MAFVTAAVRPFMPPLVLELEIIVRSRRLQGYANPDPADRLLVATALVHGLHIVTADRSIHDWGGVVSVW